MSMGLPSLAEDPQQINSLLNIRPRPGPTGGPMVPFPHANQLEMRCLTTVTSGSNNGCGFSSLSENHKPIQLAQEDGESQKSDKPKDNLVTKDEFFPFCTDDELMEFLSQLNRQEDLSMPMEELSVPTEELSVPIQESAPATQSSSQLIGKLEIPADPNYHVMTGVSVQPFFGEYPAIVSFSPPTVASVQLMPSPPVSSQPSTAFAEECMKRLSLSVNPSPPPPPVQRPTPCIPPPNQPLLDELLRPRPSGRGPGGKRCYPFDEDDQPDKVGSSIFLNFSKIPCICKNLRIIHYSIFILFHSCGAVVWPSKDELHRFFHTFQDIVRHLRWALFSGTVCYSSFLL